MTEVKMWKCDDCDYTSEQDDPNMTVFEEIKLCANCGKDICGQCAEDHVRDESGLVW